MIYMKNGRLKKEKSEVENEIEVGEKRMETD